MAYLNGLRESVSASPTAAGFPIAATFPPYEQVSPQYPYPTPYALSQQGYRRNEVLFACIAKRAAAVAEAPLRMYKRSGPGKQGKLNMTELGKHPIRELIKQPNEAMGEVEFWQATQIYLDVAGFCVWEIEFDRLGYPLHLWPMRPDWCSFLRGEHRPLRAVRYQPWGGLPFVDVPVERLLVFMEFDPIYPMLKGLSRSSIALRTVSVDNAATDFIKIFFERGAVISGLLKTQQNLNQAEAGRIRALWREQHGGVAQWGEPAVMGSGVDYQPMQMSFKDMAFDELDGRNEARICQIMETPPILIGARIGLERSTFSNYGEARKAFYEETITPRWRWLQSEIGQQLLPHYDDDPNTIEAEFDKSDVLALQEDRDAKVNRADMMFKGGWATRDEARDEADLPPVDDGVPVFATDPTGTATGGEIEQEKVDAQERQTAQLEAMRQANSQSADNVAEGDAETDGADDETNANGVDAPDAADEKQVAKALAEWRTEALAAFGREGRRYAVAVPESVPAQLKARIAPDLEAARTKQQVRGVFEKHWPKPKLVAPISQAVLVEVAAAMRQATRVAQQQGV